MPARKKQIEVLETKKVEGKPEKSTKDKSAPPEGEVGGRGATVYVPCPWCHSIRVVDLDYEGETFICQNCFRSYNVWV